MRDFSNSRVLNALALRYEKTQSGRTGIGSRDLIVDVEELLRLAESSEGDARERAELDLRQANRLGVLLLEPAHKRDPNNLDRVRLSSMREAQLYELLGRQSPNLLRANVAEQFSRACSHEVVQLWREHWKRWCQRMGDAALAGDSIVPFDRNPSPENEELLALLPKLLNWNGESLVRFASCVLCGKSKRLEELAAVERDGQFAGRLRGKLGRILTEVTDGSITCLDDLGIINNPRSALTHGPLSLRISDRWIDFGILRDPFRVAKNDLERADEIAVRTSRCLTIENEATFYEIAKLQSGELLVQTSYPGSGTLALLSRLPASLEFWHFGDSDVAGFEILRVLREKTGRDIRALHMKEGRLPFEQESLGRPSLAKWPFYA